MMYFLASIKQGQIVIPLSYTSLVATVTVALLGVLIWWVRGIPERRRAEDEGDGSMRKDLLGRITELEQLRIADRKQCAEENDALRQRIKSLEDTLTGMTRDFLAYQAAIARLHPELGAIPLGHAEDVHGIENPLRTLYSLPLDRPHTHSEPENS